MRLAVPLISHDEQESPPEDMLGTPVHLFGLIFLKLFYSENRIIIVHIYKTIKEESFSSLEVYINDDIYLKF